MKRFAEKGRLFVLDAKAWLWWALANRWIRFAGLSLFGGRMADANRIECIPNRYRLCETTFPRVIGLCNVFKQAALAVGVAAHCSDSSTQHHFYGALPMARGANHAQP